MLTEQPTAVDDGYSRFSIQRFQPCQLKKSNREGNILASTESVNLYRGPGACSPAKNFKVRVSKMPFPAF